MLSLLIVIVMMAILFKITFFVFRIVGKILGGMLGVIGWLILGGLADLFVQSKIGEGKNVREARWRVEGILQRLKNA